jgi:N-acetylmuramoyl-L-alanine amidase
VLAEAAPGAAYGRAVRTAAAAAGTPAAPKPHIRSKPIPFGHRRRRETAKYSARHYGQHTWRLRSPNVIVEHYTDGHSFRSAYNTFASNAPHMGERPGVCAHFVIDTDGTIYQIVDLGVRCRHTIGLNWTAIGIEHVGTSDRAILHNARMMRSSLHLTAWLMARYGIQRRNVIGHAESLRSPYHRERYRSWRCLTHRDWLHRDMKVYRRRLGRVARREGIPLGPRPNWTHRNC